MTILAADGSPMRERRSLGADVGSAAAAYQAADAALTDLMGWWPHLGSADGDLLHERSALVARFRDLARNDAWLSGTLAREREIVVGPELRLQSAPDWRALGIDVEAADEVAQQIEAEWRRFTADPLRRFDLGRKLTWGQFQKLAYGHRQVDGEALVVAHWRPERGGRYATCFQVVDPDRLSNPAGHPDTRRLRAGVETDADGAVVAYHIAKAHPGDPWPDSDRLAWERVDRELPWGRPQVIHHFEPDRADQTRGRPEASVIRSIKLLNHYAAMEMQAAVVNAVFAAFIESPFDQSMLEARTGLGVLSDYQVKRREFHEDRKFALNGVRIPRLFPGEKFSFSAAARPAGGFQPFMDTFLRHLAAGTGQTFMQVAQKWSDTNYSSARAALLDTWRTVQSRRAAFCAGVLGPMVLCFVEEAVDRGYVRLPDGAPDFHEAPEAWVRCRWIGPGRGEIDPTKEATAAQMRLDTLTTTLEEECALRGLDVEEVLEQRRREQRRIEELGLHPAAWTAVETTGDDGAKETYRRNG